MSVITSLGFWVSLNYQCSLLITEHSMINSWGWDKSVWLFNTCTYFPSIYRSAVDNFEPFRGPNKSIWIYKSGTAVCKRSHQMNRTSLGDLTLLMFEFCTWEMTVLQKFHPLSLQTRRHKRKLLCAECAGFNVKWYFVEVVNKAGKQSVFKLKICSCKLNCHQR